MKMYLPFGDWSDDGHGKYEKVLIEAPSMEHLLRAQMALKEQYGADFFRGYADNYEESYLSETIWQAIIESGYPVERVAVVEDSNDWESCASIEEFLRDDPNPCISLDFVIDSFIWLLNWKGAEILRLDADKGIPMICNWTCHGFETVGYGCFW